MSSLLAQLSKPSSLSGPWVSLNTLDTSGMPSRNSMYVMLPQSSPPYMYEYLMARYYLTLELYVRHDQG